MTKSIMIVGVGGQGTLLASRVLGNALLSRGFDIKLSEVHGMAQRGGSVVTYVKYGEKVSSPIVDKGEADYILAFEACEAARWLSYLKKGGLLIVNEQRIMPMPVITGAEQYPENITERLKNLGAEVRALDAFDLAQRAGSHRAVNIVLLGLLSKYMDFPPELWDEALRKAVPEKLLAINLEAFRLGAEASGK